MGIVLIASQLKAQYIHNKWGEVIPFSLTEKYKDIVKTDEIHSLVLPSYNNDSLFVLKNNGRSYDEVGSSFANGVIADTLVRFQNYAKKIKINEGTLWIMTIESSTAGFIGIYVDDFDIPEKTYFTIYPGTIPNIIRDVEVGFKEDISESIKKDGYNDIFYDNKIVVEFFVPKNLDIKPDLLINKIVYGFVGPGKPGQKPDYKKYKERMTSPENKLKSGGHTNTPALPCQKDVSCQEVEEWTNGSKSVIYFEVPFWINDDLFISRSTAFFLNKAGGYSTNDNPVLVTAGHVYNPEYDDNTYADISSNHDKIRVYVDYENKACNDTETFYGKNIVAGLFSRVDRIILGNSYNDNTSSYNESEDYAILKPNRSVEELSKYNIEYAGWTSNPVFSQYGYAAIGHPRGDVKKINVEHSYASPVNSDYFGLHFDVGVAEKGFSGSPIFNSNGIIVGWLCTGGGDCSTVGQELTTCGRFDNLYFLLTSYIDPNFNGETTSSNPSPPLPSELPAHCDNCVQDGDETGIDCGGSCYPCGLNNDVLTLKTDMDLLGVVKSRYEIFAEPDPGTLLALKSGNSSLEAGMNIYLNGGFEVRKGATFYAGIDAELMSRPSLCQAGCVEQIMGYFYPDGDGIYDYYFIAAAYVTNYNIYVTPRYESNNIIYSRENVTAHSNGYIAVWDGSGAISDGYYRVVIEATDCFGNMTPYLHYISLYMTKSATIQSTNLSTSLEKETNQKPNIEVHPNPFLNQLTISYTGKAFPLEYKITDLAGKVVLANETSATTEKINLQNLSSGAYIINAKAGEHNLVQKIIKK